MPVISALNSGLQLTSVGNSIQTGQIRITDLSGFFPLYSGSDTSGTGLAANAINGASTLQSQGGLQTGGVYLTLNPSAGPANTVLTLIKGEALTLSIEYNASNQVRFDLTPAGSSAVAMTSPWVAVGAEHSVGVSYDPTSGFTSLSVDGASITNQLTYATTGATQLYAGSVFGSNVAGASGQTNGNVTTTPTYNGYLDQVAVFNTAPTAALLNNLTSDPVGTNSALANHIETVSNSSASIFNGFNTGAATGIIGINGAVAGIQIGDIVTDYKTSNGVITLVGSSTVSGVTSTVASGTVSTSVALGSGISGQATTDTLVFTHPLSTTTSVTPVASASTLSVTGVTGVQVGDILSGYDIPQGTTVTSISGTTVTLSSALGSNVAGAESITFTHPLQGNIVTPNTVVTGTSAASVVTVASTQGVQVGDIAILSGFIPANDHVRAITGTSITLETAPTTAILTSSGNVTFVHSTYATAASVFTATSIITIANSAISGQIQAGDIVVDDTATTTIVNGTVLATSVGMTNTTVTLSAPTKVSSASSPGDLLTFTHTSSNATIGSASGGSSVVTVANGNGIQIGDIVVDTTNPSNTLSTSNGISVTGVNGNSVTLSNAIPATGVMAGDSLVLVHQPSATSSVPATTSTVPPANAGTTNTISGYQNTTGTNSVLYLSNVYGIQVGDIITGPNVPAGDTVSSIKYSGTQGASTGNATGVALSQSTSILVTNPSNFTFTHATNPDVQVIQLASSASSTSPAAYVAGDSVTISSWLNANTPVSFTYTVQSSDVSSTSPTTTLSNIAKNIVNASPVLGAYTVINGPASGSIELVPQTNTAQVLPLSTVTNSDSKGINENSVQAFYNFSSTRLNASVATTTNASSDGTVLYAATGINAGNYDASGVNPVSAATINYGTSAASTATAQLHGPIYEELVSLNGTTATYNIFVDPTYVSGGALTNAGMSINVPISQGSIVNIVPSASGTISQVNNTGNGTINYQWAANQPVTNLNAPIGQLTINLNNLSVNSFTSTITNMSVNGNNFTTGGVPQLETNTLNSQVYTVTGTVYDQFNPAGQYGMTNTGTPYGQFNTQVPLSTTDMFYTVTGAATNPNFTFAVQQSTLTPVSASSPNAMLNLSLVANAMPTTASAVPFTVTLDVPSNATGVTFTPGTGVVLTTPTSTVGHTMTVTGTYSTGKGVVGSSTPVLGTLSTILTNEFNNGGQFSMDTASLNGNAATGQSLYFGMAETNTSGQYSISNLPAGTLSVQPFNNAAALNPSSITVNDVLSTMSIAAGKGVSAGLGQAVGQANNLLPSDFVAADFNQDGQVTAADALTELNYIVAASKPSAPGFVYMNAASNSLINTPETTTNVVVPPLGTIATNLSSSNSVLLTGNSTNVVNIVGVQPGNVVNF